MDVSDLRIVFNSFADKYLRDIIWSDAPLSIMQRANFDLIAYSFAFVLDGREVDDGTGEATIGTVPNSNSLSTGRLFHLSGCSAEI